MTSNALALAQKVSVLTSSSGASTTTYANSTELPTSEVITGAMAYVSGTNKLYMWNGTAWFNIAIVNQAPTAITGNQATYFLAIDGTPTVVTLVSTDPEGLPLTWSSSTSGDTQVGTFSLTDNVFTITPSTNEADKGTLSVTFSVTDGNNTETSVSSFILEFLSPYWNETVLSIGTSSTNGLANSTFIDRSTNAYGVTLTGAPVQTAFHPYLENWGVKFDNETEKLATTGMTAAGNDFTLECWIYPTLFADVNTIYDDRISDADPNGFVLGLTAAAKVYFYTNSIFQISTTTALSTNKWYHIALVRSGSGSNNVKIYIDGVADATTATYTTEFTRTAPSIGCDWGTRSNLDYVGYISNLRLTSGGALYTAGFTSSTSALTTSVSTGTVSLLTCQSNRFIDNSTNAHTITVTGNPEISAFNPFGQESEYAAGENKGSGYFDGNDGLTGATTALTGDFTIQFWCYPLDSRPHRICEGTQTGSGTWTVTVNSSNGQVGFQYAAGFWAGVSIATATGLFSNNEWVHIAITKSGSSFKVFIDGVERGTTTNANGLINTGRNLQISYYTDGSGTTYANWYLSDLKITNDIALYTTNFTPPTAPVGNTNAFLYLPMDNAGIFDKTGNNTLTPVGNASTSTTQTKYADTAMYFDGSGDSIYIDTQPLFNFGTQDFTIEMWIKPNVSSNFGGLFTIDAGPYPSVLIYNSETNNIRIYLDNNNSSPFALTQDVTIPSTNWQHFAFTRDGNIFRSFLDGILINTTTSSITIAPQRARARIGTGDSGSTWNGYIENFQILKGVAKYTANFTPPNRTQGRGYQQT
jgi:hypothetical protein